MNKTLLQALSYGALAVASLANGTCQSTSIKLGNASAPLNGPWEFHAGDDPAWSNSNFDDSGWERVDLAAPAGAHDADVGLSGYVGGWGGRGHLGMSGYGWYRLHLQAKWPAEQQLAIAGPPAVDSAYQVFWNGRLLGGVGDFGSDPPRAVSIQPRMFAIPSTAATSEDGTSIVAVRVWMGPWDLADPQGGGMRIAPTLGTRTAIRDVYRREWIETLRGYVVEVIEAFGFACACFCLWLLARFDAYRERFYWLYAALLLTGAYRLNQALFFWGQFESVRAFEFYSPGILYPLALAAWAVAWARVVSWSNHLWMTTTAAVTALYLASTLLQYGLLFQTPHSLLSTPLHFITMFCRLYYLAATCWFLAVVLRSKRSSGGPLILMMVLVSIGQFAPELSQIGLPGIWFPFGTGVSRAQFAYAFFFLIGAVFFSQRLWLYARKIRLTRQTSATTC